MLECQAQGVKVHVAGVYGAGVLVGHNTHNYVTADDEALALGQRWAELAAAHLGLREGLAAATLFEGLGGGLEQAIELGTDSACVVGVGRAGFSARLAGYQRAIGLRVSLLRDAQEHGVARVVKVPGVANPADQLTKALAGAQLAAACKLCNLGARPRLPKGGSARVLPAKYKSSGPVEPLIE